MSLAACWRLYVPLGLTFLLVSGADPIATTGLRHLGDTQSADRALATYMLAFSLQLLAHSPLFVVREIVITFARDLESFVLARRVLVGLALCIAAGDLTLAATDLGDLVLGAMTDDPTLIPGARRALYVFAATPLFITLRGLHQALLIQADRSHWIGWGTALRLATMATVITPLVLLAPALGALAGALAFAVGILVEAGAAAGNATSLRRALAPAAEGARRETAASFLGFALPLMSANALATVAMPFFTGVAGNTSDAAASIAAFALVRTLAVTCGAPVFGLQALVTAKGERPGDRRQLARFAGHVGLLGALVLAVLASAPVAAFVLERLLAVPSGTEVYAYTMAVLPLTPLMPLLVALRSTLRGLLIRRRATVPLFLATGAGLAVPILYLATSEATASGSRAAAAFLGWMATLAIEGVLLLVVWLTIDGRRDDLP